MPPRPALRVSVLLLLVLLLAGAASSAAESGEGPKTFWQRFMDRDVQVVTVTDFSEQAKKMPAASKEHPIYYEVLILGYNDWGRPVAGHKIPEKNTMIRLIVKVLAEQGYLPSSARHPADLVIAMAWGTMNDRPGMSMLFMGGDKLDVLWELDPYIGSLLDPRMLTRHLRSPDADFVVDVAQGKVYVASLQAFDANAARRGDTVLLWHTKISCPADGLEMDSTLRQMIREAAPYVGRETVKPVLKIAEPRSGKVEIGELKVLESIDTKKLPIIDRSVPKAPVK